MPTKRHIFKEPMPEHVYNCSLLKLYSPTAYQRRHSIDVYFGYETKHSHAMTRTFGTNTRQSVTVVQKRMKVDSMRKAELGSCSMIEATATPATQMMTTLYTLSPMYLESFRAGMVTWRVSQARKQPNT